MSRAAYKKQRRNLGVTERIELPDRGRSLTIDRSAMPGSSSSVAHIEVRPADR